MASLRSISSSSTSPDAVPLRPAVYLKAANPVPKAAPAPYVPSSEMTTQSEFPWRILGIIAVVILIAIRWSMRH